MTVSTGLELLQKFSEGIFDLFESTTTSDGNSAKQTLEDKALLNEPGGLDPDFCEGWYVRIADDSSAANGEKRRIETYSPGGTDGITPTIAVGQAFSEAISAGTKYELHRFDPDLKRRTINRAIREVYPTLFNPIRDESIIIDNLLLNSGFEEFTTVNSPDDWVQVGSPTVTEENSIRWHGTSSVKVVASGADGQLTQVADVNIHELAGRTATLIGRGYSTSASSVRLRLDWGPSIASGNYHTGSTQWEEIRVSGKVPEAATQVKAICEVADGNTGRFDLVHLLIAPVYEYNMPTSLVSKPHYISEQFDVNDVDGPYYPYREGQTPKGGRLIRVEGMGLLSQPGSDTATIEIGAPQTDLVIAWARMLFWKQMANPAFSAQHQREAFMKAGDDAASEVANLSVKPGMKTPRLGSRLHPMWHTQGDSLGGTKIVFNTSRAVVVS